MSWHGKFWQCPRLAACLRWSRAEVGEQCDSWKKNCRVPCLQVVATTRTTRRQAAMSTPAGPSEWLISLAVCCNSYSLSCNRALGEHFHAGTNFTSSPHHWLSETEHTRMVARQLACKQRL